MKLITWNVNGLRAAMRAGFADFLQRTQPDVLCLQEIKAGQEDVELALFDGYEVTWNPAVKKGYSGVLLASKEKPLSVQSGLGVPEHDGEGRVLTAEFPDFFLLTVYTPNSRRGLLRLDYRLQWDEAFRRHLNELDRQKPVLFCGDLNCAHTEIDLANPRENRRNAGFTDEERAGFSTMLEAGFIDAFRAFHPDQPGHYSWWTHRCDARARNIGWRLDYWLVSRRFWPRVTGATILAEILGSDHCPVMLQIADPAAAPNGNAGGARSRKRSGV